MIFVGQYPQQKIPWKLIIVVSAIWILEVSLHVGYWSVSPKGDSMHCAPPASQRLGYVPPYVSPPLKVLVLVACGIAAIPFLLMLAVALGTRYTPQ